MNYTFHWQRESLWVVVTAIMTYVMTLAATDFESILDWRKFAIGAGAGLVRAVIGALLASQTGGFRPPVPTGPAVPTIDEAVGVSPRAIATPTLPEPTPSTDPPATSPPPTADRPYDPMDKFRRPPP